MKPWHPWAIDALFVAAVAVVAVGIPYSAYRLVSAVISGSEP